MKFLIGLLILVLLGCATSYKNQSSKETFDHIKIGDTPEVIINKVGEPQQKNEKSRESKWYYFNKNQKTLEAEVSFSEGKKVESLIIYPQKEGDKDQLNVLLNMTFKGLPFLNLKKINCQKDYYLSNEFYINKENGIIIHHNMRRKSVDYYAYQNLEDIHNLEDAFNKCLLKNW